MGKKFANLLGVLCAYALFALFGISAAADSGVINVPYWDPVTEKTQYTDATEYSAPNRPAKRRK